MQDPYTTLGISRNANADEIKKAYRKLAHQHHPDKKGGNEAKFKEINEAYQVLSDPKKKSSYDTFGSAYNDGGFQGNPYGGGQGGFGGSGFWDFFGGGQQREQQGGGFEDIFSMFSDAFGGRQAYGPSEAPSKGEDVYLEIPVHQRDLGQKKVFEFEIYKSCHTCKSSGIAPGSKMITCSVCKGAGQVRQSTKTAFGTFSRVGVCPECQGKGQKPEKLCADCKGSGRVKTKTKIEIHIPDSIENGYSMVMPKAGNAGLEGMPPGDLFMTLKSK